MIFRKKQLDRLSEMLEAGIRGEFQESRYDESKLSRLETQWKQFLESSSLSRANLEQEKENIKGLISDISHQTKTPLSNILLYSELLEERLKAAGANQEALLAGQVVKQSRKLEFLIQSLTKMSRLETDILTVEPSAQEIGTMLEAAAQEIKPKADKKGILLKQQWDGKLLAEFDRKWTEEALCNLLDNGVKYSTEGSKLILSSKSYEFYTVISVEDQGIGIPEAEIPKIFGRFYRGGQVQQEEGVGIGLYLAREILRREAGFIKVESREGEGSVFHMYLPKPKEELL